MISKCELVFFSHFRMNATKLRVCGDDAVCFGSFVNNCGTNFGSFYHPERVVQEIKYFRNRMLG